MDHKRARGFYPRAVFKPYMTPNYEFPDESVLERVVPISALSSLIRFKDKLCPNGAYLSPREVYPKGGLKGESTRYAKRISDSKDLVVKYIPREGNR
jgi:hypothetical protein